MPKIKVEYKTYVKGGQTVIADPSNSFVYETSVYLVNKGYYSLCNKKYFSSKNYIEGVVSSFNKTRHIQICSELFSAPEQWLIDNEFIRYIKPEKVKRIKTIKVEGNGK